MCLAIPSKILNIDNTIALVDIYGARREISLLLMPEEVSAGDYVIVHAGFAIQKVDTEAANAALALISEVLKAAEEEENRDD